MGSGCETENALGMSVRSTLEPISIEEYLTADAQKAGMLIYIDNFNFFSSDTELSNLSWFQKAAGTIQSLGCYIPLLFVASALLLPLGLWHTPEPPRNLSSEPAITAIRWLFLAAYVGQKINLYIVYGHCGLKTARTLKLTSIWISPCKLQPS